MPGREYAPGLGSDYRFGFNGKEKDSNGEWGSLNHYDYGFRIYNPAIARFLSVDPLTKSYPELTPYQFASNTPIQAVDLDGLELLDAEEAMLNISTGGVFLKLENISDVTRYQIQLHNRNVIDLEEKTISQKGPFPIAITGPVDFPKFYAQMNLARNGVGGPLFSNEQRNAISYDDVTGRRQPRYNRGLRSGGGTNGQIRSRSRRFNHINNEPGGIMYLPRGPKGVRGRGIIPIVIAATEWTLMQKINHDINRDYDKALSQLSEEFAIASDIVLENFGKIDPSLRGDSRALGAITNYIYQGEFGIEFDQETQSLVNKATLNILLSDPRVYPRSIDNINELTNWDD